MLSSSSVGRCRFKGEKVRFNPHVCPPYGKRLASSSWRFSCVMRTLMLTDRDHMEFTTISCSLELCYPSLLSFQFKSS